MYADVCEQSSGQLTRIENINDEQKNLLGELTLTNCFQFQSLYGSEKELTDKLKRVSQTSAL